MTAVLHTWGQALMRHVHLHCLVPGGALSEQGQWNPATSTYLFPVRALSRHVRGGFVSRLRQAINDGRFAERLHADQALRLPGQPLSTPPLGADPNGDQGESH